MEQVYKHTDLFLTHTWRADLHGRDNHARVRVVNEHLNRLGYLTWFDEKSMTGNIEAKMAEEIDYTKCALIFVTEQYMMKIDSLHQDNCKFEFDRALAQKTDKDILCIVLEEKYDHPNNWFGKLKKNLSGCLYVSMTGDLNNKQYLKNQLQLVVEQLKSKGVTPSQTKNKCENCMVVNKDGQQQAFFTDGDACTFCSSILQKTNEPKNYCVACNNHVSGDFCNVCRVHLLDKNQRIHDLEEKLLSAITVETSDDLSKYDAASFNAKIEKLKEELDGLRTKREEAKASDIKLQINETEYGSKMEDLLKKMEDVLENTNTLTATKEELVNSLQPSYKEELSQFEARMRSLEEKRKVLEEHTGNLSKTAEELQQLDKQLLEFASDAVEKHGKTCSCDDCTFERELNSQMISNGPKFLESLIKENKIEKVKFAMELQKEIMELKEDHEFNLLLYLTVRYGTVEMLTMLMEKGLNLEVINSSRQTLLHFVDKVDVCVFLCEKFGDKLLTIKDKFQETPFIKAHLDCYDVPIIEAMRPFVKDPVSKLDSYPYSSK